MTDPDTGLAFRYLRYTETQSKRLFVTVECLHGYEQALADGIKRIVKRKTRLDNIRWFEAPLHETASFSCAGGWTRLGRAACLSGVDGSPRRGNKAFR